MKKILLLSTSLLWLGNAYSQCSVPGSVTANPVTICAGSTSSLNASSTGTIIKWYTVPTGGVPTGTSLSGANFTVSPPGTSTYYAEGTLPLVAGGSTTLNFTGSAQQITIPAGVNSITITARGAQGGNSGYTGANGGMATGVLTVTPGQILNIYVGGQGTITAGGYNGGGAGGGAPALTFGGGGGGASDIRIGGIALANRVLIAAGGGGSGGSNSYNATGGTGGGGSSCVSPFGFGGGGANGCGLGNNGDCNGGTAVNYGTGGGGGGLLTGAPIAGSGTGVFGTAGVLGIGGDGGNYVNRNGGGGGGGGYYGGAGGMSGSGGCNGGGGGGSSYVDNAMFTSILFSAGTQTGNGLVVIDGISGGCASVSRTPITVTVNPSPTVSIAGGTTAVCAGSSVALTASGATSYSWNTGAVTATIAPTPTANASYTVVGTSAGCTGSAVTNVTVTPGPVVSISGNTLICGTGTNVLTAAGANTYSWNTGPITASISASPSVTTIYNVIGTSSVTGCSTTATVSVVVGSIPSVSVAGGGTICAGGQSATLTASGANTYSWSTGSTSANIVVTPTASATYTAIGTNSAGCSASATVSVVVDPCTGLSTVTNAFSNLSVYPNPSNGDFTIELKNGLSKTIEITDYTGKLVFTSTSSKDIINVNLNSMANGIYNVKIQSNNTIEILKIVKQ